MIEIRGPVEVVLWLAALEAGPLVGCIVCRSSTIWRHPRHGGVHPQCVPVAMRALDGDDRRPAMSVRRPGAYGRYAGVVE